jgi:hypothetical protein
MREIIFAFAAMAAISVVSYYALHEIGFSAVERTSGSAVRLTD